MRLGRELGFALICAMLGVTATGCQSSNEGRVSVVFTERDRTELPPDDTAIISLYLEPDSEIEITGATLDADDGIEAQVLGLCRVCLGRVPFNEEAKRSLEKNLIPFPATISPDVRMRASFRVALNAVGKAAISERCLKIKAARLTTRKGSQIIARYDGVSAPDYIVALELPEPRPNNYRRCDEQRN